MYTFPKRSEQHIVEQKSLAILLYYLKDFGIVRNITDNDYGIDLVYEFTTQGLVIGKTIKIQLKAKKKIKINKDKTITISGIKQSTLNYWAEISYNCNVILVAVDIEKEIIYVSKPIFWDAVRLIDNTNKTKSIRIKTYKETNVISPIIIDSLPLAPCFSEIRLYHKMALNMLKYFIEECYFSTGCDYDCEVNDYYNLDILLEVCKKLFLNLDMKNKIDKVNKVKDWSERSAYYNSHGYIEYRDISKLYSILLNLLLDYLINIRNKMMDSFIFWLCKDLEYYKYVLSFDLNKDLLADSDKFDKFERLDDNQVSELIDKQIKEIC